jgi:hypothetical protein
MMMAPENEHEVIFNCHFQFKRVRQVVGIFIFMSSLTLI